MALPIPSLDTRRFDDLVEEGRALLPRLAPGWTDHNLHDPGITLVELLAWLVEQEIYRASRITERHRRAFLALVGHLPAPPRPSDAAVAFDVRPGSPPMRLPAGAALAATSRPGDGAVPFVTTAPITLLDARIGALQVAGSARIEDVSRAWHDGEPIRLLREGSLDASDPDRAPALLVGLDRPLAAGAEIALWVGVLGGGDARAERRRIREEATAQARNCGPRPARSCADDEAPRLVQEPLRHHCLTTTWEAYDGAAWSEVPSVDDTRALTLDGAVVLRPERAVPLAALGEHPRPLAYLRCLVVAGVPDVEPLITRVEVNAVGVEQRRPARAAFEIAPGTPAPTRPPAPGERLPLELRFDQSGRLSRLDEAAAGADAPEALVLEYRAALPGQAGLLVTTLAPAGVATGRSGQRLALPDAPIADGAVHLWSIETDGARAWNTCPDVTTARRSEATVGLDAATAELVFGDGWRGRVAAPGTPFLAGYDTTLGAAGNVPSTAVWRLAGADDELNDALLTRSPEAVQALLVGIRPLGPAAGGLDAEGLGAAAPATRLWAHERLLELAPGAEGSLDGLVPIEVTAGAVPERATTLRDLERIALGVPGTRVLRARAWAGRPPLEPCVEAPGHLTCVILPGFPADRPVPGPGLLGAVRRALGRRRVIGTHIAVVGPTYVEISLSTRLVADRAENLEEVRRAAAEAFTRFLSPLRGGPRGRGWPFGRDVHRSELLALLDGVTGVDHVGELALWRDGHDPDCGGACLGPAELPVPGAVTIEVTA